MCNKLLIYQPAHSKYTTDLSDIWGWVDSQGNEYAIVGTNEGTSIFSLANPSQPIEVFFEQGMNSIWRDIKHLVIMLTLQQKRLMDCSS